MNDGTSVDCWEHEEPIDCRSEEGVTIGLIDALISVARIVAKRDLKNPAVREALADFCDDEDVHTVLNAALYARNDIWLDKLMEDK